ncbi:MAG: BspA family leucine-rich repeat surface protein [Mucispirillum sp.]|nr:BspA family leucine-rich repeat surface protein [Mucispirillum sp.]
MDIVILIVFAAFAIGIAVLILKIVFIFFKELEKNKINENQENNNIEISENIDTKNNAEPAENNNITDDNNIVTYNRVAADSNIVTDSNIKESSDTDIINNIETDSNTEEINSNKEETDNKQPESSTKYSNYKVNHQVSIKDIQSDDVYLNVDEISTSDEITVSENAYNKLYKQEDYDKYYLGNKKIEENRKKLFNIIKDKFYALSYSKRELYLNRVNGKYTPNNKYQLNILLNNEKVTLNEIDISLLSNLDNVFKNSKRQNYKGIEQWDTSKIVSMKNMFLNAEYFNEDISLWKVDRVKNMQSMFEGAVNFNQNLNSWNVLPGTKIDNMFKNTPLSENPPKWVTSCFEYQNSHAFYNFQKLFIIFILSIYIITVYFIPKQQFYIKYTPETKDELSMLIKTQKIPLWLINTKKNN